MKNINNGVLEQTENIEKETDYRPGSELNQQQWIALPSTQLCQIGLPVLSYVSCPLSRNIFSCMWIAISIATSLVYTNGKTGAG